ncbi:MAG: hypothetical protein IJG68_03490 [Bacilli bacterium]|nr:hypothetical protein [Bacilli bacterium]
MQKSNLIKKLLVVVNFIVVIFLIATIIFNTKLTYSLYWISIPVLIFLIVWFMFEVDKGLIEINKNEGKSIRRSYNDITVVSTVFYGLIYLGIEFIDMINHDIRNNIYLVCGFFAITLLYELFVFTAIKSAKKETSELLNNKFMK